MGTKRKETPESTDVLETYKKWEHFPLPIADKAGIGKLIIMSRDHIQYICMERCRVSQGGSIMHCPRMTHSYSNCVNISLKPVLQFVCLFNLFATHLAIKRLSAIFMSF